MKKLRVDDPSDPVLRKSPLADRKPAVAVGSVVFGVLGVGAVPVLPTAAFILGALAIALGAYGRRSFGSWTTAATVGLVLGTLAMAGVAFVIVFFSG